MTRTINSFKSNTRYFLTFDDQGVCIDCSCGDRTYRHYHGSPDGERGCKHMQAANAEIKRAETFAGLRKQFDCRLQPVRVQVGKPVYTEAIDDPFFHPEWVAQDAERTAYLNYLLSIGA